MKKYIILTNSITNMGGGQMFAANKSIYLRDHGWNVSIFFSNPQGNIFIPELQRYKENCVSELNYPFYFFSKKKRTKVLSKIIKEISKDDEVVIETHTYVSRYWGELIAKAVGGKHIIDDLGEILPELNKNELDYLEWKLKRKEILNVDSEKSLQRYLNSKYTPDYLRYIHNYMVMAYCSNVTTSVKADLSQIPVSDFTILSVGRLDKPYILPSVQEVIKFAKYYTNYRFNLLFVGGSTKGDADKKILELCKNIPNLHVHNFGYIFPVPENIIDSADAAFASSNSVLVSANRGVPTISIDVHDMQPIGIYGKTTNSHLLRNSEPIVPIYELLKQILVDKIYLKENKCNDGEKDTFNKVFGKQTEFLTLSPYDGLTYDIDSLFPWYSSVFSRIKLLAYKIFNVLR